MNNSTLRYSSEALERYSRALLIEAGVEQDIASVVANILVEGDLLGHTTHGMAQLTAYLDNLTQGKMAPTGTYTVVSERPAVITWDGNWLPGPWLTWNACQEARKRALTYGTGTVVIRRSHHIACLAAYLEPLAAEGLMCIIQSADPSVRAVAAHGGTRPVLTPNPIAVGIPTRSDPILIDVSMSIGTVGMARRLISLGERTTYPWLLDGQGSPTDDPTVLDADPRGSLMLLGGVESGHKGFGLALMVEAMTSALAGHGRADQPTNWGASVFVQVLDPAAFGGTEAYLREMTYIADDCRAGPHRDDNNPTRMPGSAGLARKRYALEHGIELHPTIMPSLSMWSERLNVEPPQPNA